MGEQSHMWAIKHHHTPVDILLCTCIIQSSTVDNTTVLYTHYTYHTSYNTACSTTMYCVIILSFLIVHYCIFCSHLLTANLIIIIRKYNAKFS